MPRKIALLIGVSEYGEGIPPLSAPPNDVEAMRRVLADPNLGGFDEVRPLINPNLEKMQIEIRWLFANREKEDLLLLFFSGHGITDDDNHLYLTTGTTAKYDFDATAVPASFVHKQSRHSLAKRQIMILDCCYSGAFSKSWQTKSVIERELGAKGRAVLTSSSATQTSVQNGSGLSLYTQYLVEGIETGEADQDKDGKIHVQELHDYAKMKVQRVNSNMKPEIIILDKEAYKILLANAPKDPKVLVEGLKRKIASLELELGRNPRKFIISTISGFLLGLGSAISGGLWHINNQLEQQLFSRGDRILIPENHDNKALVEGIKCFNKFEFFQTNNYSEAKKFFEQATQANRQDPESKIYFNNAKALNMGNPVTLAVVVPLDTKIKIAEEILRGVAQAQDNFNNSRGAKGRLLKIVIAKDGNETKQAEQVAQRLIKDQSIMGVIGHNSSNVTEAALFEYDKSGMATISPTSTSTSPKMKKKVFFRTVPNDHKTGEELADYAKRYKRVVIFNNPYDSYSRSITNEFQNSFRKKGGVVVEPLIDLTKPNINPTSEIITSIFDKNKQANAAVLLPNTEYISVGISLTSAQNNLKSGIEKLPLLGADSLYNQDIFNPGKAVEGLVLAVPWFPDEAKPNSIKFANKAKEIWGEDVSVSWRTAASYDATQAFIKALSSSNNPSRQTVLDNLKNRNFSQDETSGNPLTFMDGERQGQEPALVKVVRDSSGKLKFELVTK